MTTKSRQRLVLGLCGAFGSLCASANAILCWRDRPAECCADTYIEEPDGCPDQYWYAQYNAAVGSTDDDGRQDHICSHIVTCYIQQKVPSSSTPSGCTNGPYLSFNCTWCYATGPACP